MPGGYQNNAQMNPKSDLGGYRGRSWRGALKKCLNLEFDLLLAKEEHIGQVLQDPFWELLGVIFEVA